ncbi:MAG TPA: glycosyltransferase family 1 protein [Candidatus Saccharimonadales bacterium]|nr:glycosyltransferase family 1 protein [Candidatus Saccharimonadales bacterium]
MSKHIVIDCRIRQSSTGRYADRLIEHLQTLDTTNHYTILVKSSDTWQPKAPNFAVEFCDYSQFSFSPLEQTGFTTQLGRLKPDLVHFTMNQQPIFYSGKAVTSTLDLTMLNYTRPGKTLLPIFWLKMLGYRFIFWLSNHRSQAIITLSNYTKDTLAKKYPFTKDKTYVTYCASEPPISLAAAEPYNIREPFILYVGSAFPHKNLERLIKAFEIIHTKNPTLNLVLAGPSEYYYAQLQKIAAKSPASKYILFTGFVSEVELKWLYEKAKAYVFPSLSEGFGLPGLEAMVHGCPVVSSNATCLPEIYRNAALYFDPKNVNDMAEKISSVLDNSALGNELAVNGSKVVKLYSWHKMAEETLAIYNKVLTPEK